MLIVVRNMSMGRSTASMVPMINPTCASEKPIACVTMKITTTPAAGMPAAPIDESSAVSTMRNCCERSS